MRYDLAVIGGGSAGLVAALGAAAVGARVALVERRAQTGGDCLWTGCVPSKSLIAAAELAHRMRTADHVGLPPVEPEIDFAAVMAHVRGAQRAIEPHDSADRLRRAGVDVLFGEARFERPGALAVDGRTVRFRSALIATGSEPVMPSVDGLDAARPLTNESVWELTELPRRLVVVGGGPVGCELGQAFARLGSRISIVQRGARLLPRDEPEASELIAEHLRADGVEVRLGASAQRVVDGTLEVEQQGGRERLEFDRILVAAGRRPVTEALNLASVGVRTGEKGAIETDSTLRTSVRGIYAGGDVTGTLPFTHVAGQHGATVIANALFHTRRRIRTDAVPWVTFTDPEVGRVGLSESQARERFGDDVVVERFDYDDLDRAITAGRPYGFAKLVGDPKGRLVGATVAAPRGGEAIAELTAWVSRREKISTVSQTVHAYPTFAEGPARAAQANVRRRIVESRLVGLARPALRVLRALERPPGAS